jgi:hypothetical protein
VFGYTRCNYGGERRWLLCPSCFKRVAKLYGPLNGLATASNCSSSASPAVCGSAVSGSVAVPASVTTEVVNTTAVTANSQI